MRFFLLIALMACAKNTDTGVNTPPSTTTTTTPSTTETTPPTTPNTSTIVLPDGVTTVELLTKDGVALKADHHPTTVGAPGILLLHMIPPSNDRTNWPESFINELVDEGWQVLNVDRRGAGESDGTAKEAYEGKKGKWDAKAGVTYLTSMGATKIAILGASNGTTTMLDYSVYSVNAADSPTPVAVALLSGGTYTENQNPMTAMPAIPAYFAFPTNESAWPNSQRSLSPGSWVFEEYTAGHGTQMFSQSTGLDANLVTFLSEHLNEQ